MSAVSLNTYSYLLTKMQPETEYSFGVVCKYKDMYLFYRSSKKNWVFHKGHFESSDAEMTEPYSHLSVVPIVEKCTSRWT